MKTGKWNYLVGHKRSMIIRDPWNEIDNVGYRVTFGDSPTPYVVIEVDDSKIDEFKHIVLDRPLEEKVRGHSPVVVLGHVNDGLEVPFGFDFGPFGVKELTEDDITLGMPGQICGKDSYHAKPTEYRVVLAREYSDNWVYGWNSWGLHSPPEDSEEGWHRSPYGKEHSIFQFTIPMTGANEEELRDLLVQHVQNDYPGWKILEVVPEDKII